MGKTFTRNVVIKNVIDEKTTVAYDNTTATRSKPKGAVNGFKLKGHEKA